MKKIKKGFTLVELIVVITILAILGTIGFISLQGYSSDARNSKRTSDLNQLASQLTAKLTSGLGLLTAVSSDSLAKVSGIKIAGTGASTSPSDYEAGKVNYTALGVKQSDFQDSVFNVPYAIGATTKLQGKYQLATKLESGGGGYIAKVTGDYNPRTSNVTVALTSFNGTAKTVTITNNSDIGKLYSGDTINGANLTGATIVKVSTDGKTLTLNGTPGSTTSLTLSNAETAGLIDAGGSSTGAVVTDGIATFPY